MQINTNRLIENKQQILIVLTGILIRLGLMPFAFHYDMMSMARRVTILLFDGVFLMSNWAELTYAALILPLKGLLGHLPAILFLELSTNISIVPGQLAYNAFIQSHEAFFTLFLLKLPYLIVDILLLVIVATKIKCTKANLIFWAINPFILYSVYMWGRYEILPVIFALSSLIIAREAGTNSYKLIPALLMGLAIGYRVSFLIFLPLLLIYLSRNVRDLILLLFLSLSPFVVFSTIVKTLGGGGIIQDYFINIALTAKIGEGFFSTSLFVVAFFSILYLALRDKTDIKLTYNRFVAYSAFLILSYYAFCIFHPQYMAWVTPVAIILIGIHKRFFWPFIVLFIPLFFLIDAYYGCYASVCMVSDTINTGFAHSFNTFKTQLAEVISDANVLTFFHSAFVSVIIYICYLIKKYVYEDKLS